MGPGLGGGCEAGDWNQANREQQLSAAGPGRDLGTTRKVVLGACGDVSGEVNPPGFPWELRNYVPAERTRGFEEMWNMWRGCNVAGSEAPKKESLDHWQRFAYDIADRRAEQRVKFEQSWDKRGFAPLRMLITGTAGAGKSLTVRAIVGRRRALAAEQGRTQGQVSGSCVLAAPTGCAAFQMKFGASTVHRAFGLGISFCGPSKKQSESFLERAKRLREATLFILDEFSMLSRAMVGKVLYRAREVFGAKPDGWGRDVTMGGRDTIFSGDPRQAQPIGGEPFQREGPYKGKGLNKPRSGEAPPGTPDMHALTSDGVLFREEFMSKEGDVVILHEVHRISREDKSMSQEKQALYAAEADRFLTVTAGMSECTWIPGDRDWLARRERGQLERTPEGQQALKLFKNAPVLMDGRKVSGTQDDVADVRNAEELTRLCVEQGTPILRCRAFHKDFAEDMKPELMDSDNFQGLKSNLDLCEGARVLLTQNEWVEAGLMNGAIGDVVGFVWGKGGCPDAKDIQKQAPICVVVLFDDVDLGSGADGQPRCFFPELCKSLSQGGLGKDDSGRWKACRLVPIFRRSATAEGEDSVSRWQFPLTLAWALTHWKAQGMTLRRARVRVGAKVAAMVGIGFVAMTRVKHPWEGRRKGVVSGGGLRCDSANFL